MGEGCFAKYAKYVFIYKVSTKLDQLFPEESIDGDRAMLDLGENYAALKNKLLLSPQGYQATSKPLDCTTI